MLTSYSVPCMFYPLASLLSLLRVTPHQEDSSKLRRRGIYDGRTGPAILQEALGDTHEGKGWAPFHSKPDRHARLLR